MADGGTEFGVRSHYSVAGVAARALAALAAQGIGQPGPPDLAPVDQLHTGGIRATRELASLLELGPGDRDLDLGCGLGGPARCIASGGGARSSPSTSCSAFCGKQGC